MLTDTACKRATANGRRQQKYADQHGLYLMVLASGAKGWRWDYRLHGRRKTLSFGAYPFITLAKARERHTAARLQLAAGDDPSRIRKLAKLQAHGETFRVLADEWLAKRARQVDAHTLANLRFRLDQYILPKLGASPVHALEPLDILAVLKPIEDRGHAETTKRARQIIGQILRYAVATGRAARDVSADLRDAFAPVKATHHPALTDPAAIGGLLRAIDSLTGSPTVTAALKLSALLFVRPGELRRAEWAEMDLDAALWRIPAARMKMRDAHLVPLCREAVVILRDLQTATGQGRYCFPSLRSAKRPLAENTLNGVLRRLGYGKDEMTMHGFRTMASTRLNELGWAPDLIELQLAHRERTRVRAAYNRAERLEERTAMMQAYADHLAALTAAR